MNTIHSITPGNCRTHRRDRGASVNGQSTRNYFPLSIEQLEIRRCLTASPGLLSASINLPTDPNVSVAGQLQGIGSSQLYHVSADTQGFFTAQANATAYDTRLSLLDSQGHLLIESEASSSQDPDDKLAIHLTAGDYFLMVQESTAGSGTFSLSTTFVDSTPPSQPLSGDQGSISVAVGDLNSDGIPDIITADFYVNQVLVSMGVGDGTFQPPLAIPVGAAPSFVTTADLTRDGHLDIITVNQASNDLSILLGNGDGTFQPAITVPAGAAPSSLAVGDFTGSGILDLAVADQNSNELQILLGNGDGKFTQGQTLRTDSSPKSVVAADLNGNGRQDLAVTCFGSSDVDIFAGNGDGTFNQVQQLATDPGSRALVAADFTGSGLPDLAVVCSTDNSVDLFTNHSGVFVPSGVLKAGNTPYAITAVDANNDGNLDLAVANSASVNVSLFLGNGDGTFQTPYIVSTGEGPEDVVAADLTNQGRADLITADYLGLTVSVLLGNGDGAFQSPQETSPQSAPASVVAADLTNDGIQDLIIPNFNTNDISILLGRGDGTFRAPILVPAGFGPFSVAVGDFTDDGILDLAVVNQFENTVSILLGNGDGTFRPDGLLATQTQPAYITTADLDDDGNVDLILTNYISDSVSVYYGNGDGTFQNQVVYPVGGEPDNPLIVDLTGNGRLDIVTPNAATNDLSVLMATGTRSFAPAVSIPAGPAPWYVAAGDLSGNGIQDLVVSDYNSQGPSYVTVLMGNGDGTFHLGETLPVGTDPNPVTLADLTGNGILDILVGNDGTSDLSLLMGRGDGTFLPEVRLPAGPGPYQVTVADYNGDGKPDIAIAEYGSDEVTVLLNLGDGSFAPPDQIPTVATQIATVSADFNGDARQDLAVADPIDDIVIISLGNGDGTFTHGQIFPVGIDPTGLVVADFNGDGFPDLAVADQGSNDVAVMLGLGNGNFASPTFLPVGVSPHSIVAGDFLSNGIIDIAVADEMSNNVALLIGRGDGTFLPARFLTVGNEPIALVAADLLGNGQLQLCTINRSSGDLTVLWNLGLGVFQPQSFPCGGTAPAALTVGDFTGNGRVDLAVSDQDDDLVTVLMNLGNGNFAPAESIDVGIGAQFLLATQIDDGQPGLSLVAAGVNSQNGFVIRVRANGTPMVSNQFSFASTPAGISLGDFNGDGIPDLAIVTFSSNQIDVRLGTENGQFLAPEDAAPLPQSAPIVVDWLGNGSLDVFQLNQEGQLLLRLAQPGSPAQFQAPQIVDPGLDGSFRDIVLIQTSYGPVIAALQTDQPVIWLFSRGPGPAKALNVESITVSNASLLVSLAAGDLTRDGREDLVAVDRGTDQLIVLFQQVNGTFVQSNQSLPVEQAPSEVTIADLNQDSWPDLVVSNTYSGDLSIFYGGPGGQFSPAVVLAGGLGAALVVSQGDDDVRTSSDQPTGLTTAYFSASGSPAIVSVQSGSDRISLLEATPTGGLADPSLATSWSTGIDPTQVIAAPLTNDGLTDLIVLNQGSDDISIFLNNGHGGFVTMPSVNAGNGPTGVAVSDIDQNNTPDLLVTNGQGDLLIIIGNGDGTFNPYERAEQTVSLAVGDFNKNGQNEYVLSDTSIDQLSIQYNQTQSFVQGRSNGLQAPGAVAVADLTGDGNEDIIVLNSGENDMLIYLGLGGNQFQAPLQFFTGTAPVGLTVGDLTDTSVPDIIVANEGSNDLSVFVGVGQGANWTLQERPRLAVGTYPVSTTIVNDDGIPDIISVDQGSNNVEILPGVGDGFFDEQDPIILPTGASPIRAFVGKFDSSANLGLAVLDAGSSNLAYYANIAQPAASPTFISTGGLNPITGVITPKGADGYANLYIADGGDNRIAVFTGSPIGLIPSGSIILGASEQPTDLALAQDDEGHVQLVISAVNQNQVVFVTVSLGLTVQPLVPGFSPTAPGSTSGVTSAALASSPNAGLFSLGGSLSGSDFQEQGANTAALATAGSASAIGSAAIALINVATNLTQLVTPSIGSLNSLVNNLAQLGQIQISDIIPLDHGPLDSVAVLVAVSGFALDDPTGAGTIPGNPDLVALDEIPERPSNVSRFEQDLAGFDHAIDSVARDLLAVADISKNAGFGSDWQPGNAHAPDRGDRAIFTPNPLEIDPETNTHSFNKAPVNVDLPSNPSRTPRATHSAPAQSHGLTRLNQIVPIGLALGISLAVVAWSFLKARAKNISSAGTGQRLHRHQSQPRRSLNSRGATLHSARGRDLPPWFINAKPTQSPTRNR